MVFIQLRYFSKILSSKLLIKYHNFIFPQDEDKIKIKKQIERYVKLKVRYSIFSDH